MAARSGSVDWQAEQRRAFLLGLAPALLVLAAITVAPATFLAIWMPMLPRFPPAPITRMVSPAFSAAQSNRSFHAVGACRMITAASWNPSGPGTVTAATAGTVTSSAKPPGRRTPSMPRAPE